jgi:hypothetical protein
VPGVEQSALKVVLEHVVERLPIHACWFHPHQFDLEGGQPVPKLQQSPWVVVLNLRISWWGSSSLFLAVAILTHAVMEALCTSSPAHLWTILFKLLSFRSGYASPYSPHRYREEPLVVLKNLVFVL